MPRPRFSIQQLLLGATLVALAVGLFSAADRLGPRDRVCQLCFSPSGKSLAARYETGVVRVWRVDGQQAQFVAQAFGEPPLDTRGNQWLLQAMYFVDDNELLKLESQEGKLRVDVHKLEIDTGKVSTLFSVPVRFVQQWSAGVGGNRLYVSDWGSTNLLCYDLRERQLEHQYTVGTNPAYGLRVSRDGNAVAVVDSEQTVHVIDTENWQTINRLSKTLMNWITMPVSRDGRKVVMPVPPAYSDGAVRQRLTSWDTASGESETWPTSLDRIASWMEISADDRRLAVSDGIEAVEFYDLPSKELVRRIPFSQLRGPAVNRLSYFELSPDGDTLATMSNDQIVLWDVATGSEQKAIGGQDSRAMPIAIFTGGFALWAAVWGVVRKRDRRRMEASQAANAELQQQSGSRAAESRPEKLMRSRIVLVLLWLAVGGILLVETWPIELPSWRDIRNWWISITPVQLLSLVLLPCLVVLLRHLAMQRAHASTGNRAAPTTTGLSQALRAPLALKMCWGLMVVGGLLALVVPISFLFLNRSAMLWASYYGLFLGVVAISRGAARDTVGLPATTLLQAIHIVAFEPINLVLAAVERLLLRGARVQRYLAEVNNASRVDSSIA